jgi:hypothetical protein
MNDTATSMSAGGALALLAALLGIAFLSAVGMSFVFARMTGWTRLAKLFPARLRFEGRRYRVNGVTLGSWGWNAPPLWAGLDDRGIVLRAVPPFALAFRPIHLPWSAIKSVTHRDYLLFGVLELCYGAEARARIGFVPSPVASLIEERIAANAAASLATPGKA